MLAVSAATVYRMIAGGNLNAVRVNHIALRVSAAAIRRLVDE